MYKNIGQIISDVQIDQKKSKKNRTIDRTNRSDIQIDQKKSKKNRTIDRTFKYIGQKIRKKIRTLKYIGKKIGQKKSEKKSGIQIERTKNWTKNIGQKNLTFK